MWWYIYICVCTHAHILLIPTGHLRKISCVFKFLLSRDQSSLRIYFLPYFPQYTSFLLFPASCSGLALQKPISEYFYSTFGNDNKERKNMILLKWKNKQSQIKFSWSLQQDFRTLEVKINRCKYFPCKGHLDLQPALLYIKYKCKVVFSIWANS